MQSLVQADSMNHCDPYEQNGLLRRSQNADLTNVARSEQAHHNSTQVPRGHGRSRAYCMLR